jgi:hypothetical protein
MEGIMKMVFTGLGVILSSLLCTVFYYNRFIDDVAQELSALIQRIMPTPDYYIQTTGGYLLAEFVVPLTWGVILGTLAAGLLGKNFLKETKNHWWLLLLGSFFALLPSLYYVVFMTFLMEGS